MLTPPEEKKGFLTMLQGKNAAKVPLQKLSINPTKTVLVSQRASSLVASNVNLHTLAKKAFQSHVRSIYFMPQKDIFDVKDLPVEEYSKSLGLASAPNLRFLKGAAIDRSELREKKNVNHKLQRLKDQIKVEKLAKKLKKMGKSEADIKEALEKNARKDEDESEDEILVSKRQLPSNDDDDDDDKDEVLPGIDQVSQSRHAKKIRIDGAKGSNKRIVFNEDGDAVDRDELQIDLAKVTAQVEGDKASLEQATDDYLAKVRERLDRTSEQDRIAEKERLREKRKKQRLKEKGDREEGDAPVGASLEVDSDAESVDNSSSASSSSDDSSSDDESDTDLKAQEEMALSLIRGQG
jgi:ATP-dependent RNA helicase DDX10/DBP4